MPTLIEEYRSILSANIITLLGIELLPEEKKMEIITQAQDLVQRRVMLRVLDTLKPEDQGTVEKAEAEGKLTEFLAARVPNWTEIIMQEIARVKIELMEAKTELVP